MSAAPLQTSRWAMWANTKGKLVISVDYFIHFPYLKNARIILLLYNFKVSLKLDDKPVALRPTTMPTPRVPPKMAFNLWRVNQLYFN